MHSLLARQIKRHIGPPEALPADLLPFVEAVNAAYEQEDGDRTMLERSLDIVSHELGERNQALRFMTEVSSVLSSSLDYETTLSNVAKLAVPRLADYCGIDLLMEDGSLQRLFMHHVDPQKAALAQSQRSFPRDSKLAWGLDQVLERGESLVIPEITDEMVAAAATSEEHLRVMREMGVRSTMRVPLTVRGKVTGVVTFFYAESGRRYTPGDLELAEDLARRAATAIDNARLYREARQAEEQLRNMNLALEERVAARTSELEAANLALEKANRRKSEFLASMSHELRTPLNAIIGFSEVLLDPELNQMPAEQRDEFVGNIHRSGKHLLGIINDILDLSKVEAGHMEIHPEAVSLREVIDACVSTIRPLADKKSIALTSTCEPADVQAWADPARLKQVLYNLLSNAVKFTPTAGQVTVAADVADGQARVKVRDTGIGISPEDRELVFEDFRQVDQGVAREQEGTGLGLALVKRFVELHGGTVGLESAVGQGSCFTITLPLPAEGGAQPLGRAPKKSLDAVPDEARSNGLTVLMVEDDDEAAELLRLHLGHAGYRVRRAANGEEAVSLARDLHPFAITLDVLMPEKDGWQVISALKSDPATASIPVVLVTSVDNPSLGFALGAEDYLVKPIQKDRLLATLQRATMRTADGGQMTVLVVDDDPVAAGFLEAVVQGSGGKAVVAMSGPEALKIAAEQQVDAVLLDLLMPGMSGFEVLEELRKSPNTSGLPVVVCTAKDLSADEAEALRGEVAGVLQKGVDVKQRVLDELIRLERAHPSRAGLAGEDATLANFLSHVNREASRAKRYGRVFCVLAASLRSDDPSGAGQDHLSELAAQICQPIGKQLRRHDILVHHAHGEILALLPECGPEAAQPVVAKLQAATRQQARKLGVSVTLEIGCACWPEDGKEAQQLLQAARRRAIQSVSEPAAAR